MKRPCIKMASVLNSGNFDTKYAHMLQLNMAGTENIHSAGRF